MAACSLGSCESILEIDPISEITMANYWKSESDVKGYLNGLYSDYRGMTSTTLYGEDRGDAMVSGVIGGVSRSHQHELNEEYEASKETAMRALKKVMKPDSFYDSLAEEEETGGGQYE